MKMDQKLIKLKLFPNDEHEVLNNLQFYLGEGRLLKYDPRPMKPLLNLSVLKSCLDIKKL
jgi:hypothetical protein